MAKKKANKVPMLLTPAEMAALAPFEENMHTAVTSDYSRSIGIGGANLLNGILKARGLATVPDAGLCVSCTLALLKRVGKMYFETKEQKRVQQSTHV